MYNTNRLEYFYNRVNSEINEEYESEENQLSTVDTAIIDINNFKIDIHNTARRNLDISSWEKEDTGSGKIINRIIKAIEFSKNNLLQHQPKWGLERRSHHSLYEILEKKENIEMVEQLFYGFYKSQNIEDEIFFNKIVKFSGKKYDFIAYLFFIKDKAKYCSLSPKPFDDALVLLGIQHTTSRHCSFENYSSFLNELDHIKEYLSKKIDRNTNILDAHSFLWLIHDMEDDYITSNNETPIMKLEAEDKTKNEDEREQKILIVKYSKASKEDLKQELRNLKPNDPEEITVTQRKFKRDNKTVAQLKIVRDFKCQICNTQIQIKNNNFYIEAAHIIPKAKKGNELPDNILILCPNHHKEFDLSDRVVISHTKKEIVFEMNGKEYCINLKI